MKISALRLHNVKRFAGRGVAIEGIRDGVNVLCAANEFGKSTSFEALHALFFQPHSSTGIDVRNLRPYSGGHPLVEADISTAAGAFRITKQFYGKGSARVVDLETGVLRAQADEAETLIAGLVKGGTAGPAGLLWVRQGVTGIERRNKSDDEGETKIRTSLLQSVQGEVEVVTGGRRMSEIMAAVEEAIDGLVTRKGPKAGGRYAVAIGERDRLLIEESRLGAEVRVLRETLDRRAAAARQLAELDRPADRDESRAAIERAQTAFDAANTQAETLCAAEAQYNLARERRLRAHRDLEDFRAARDKANTLAIDLGEAHRRRMEALATRDSAIESAAKAQAALAAADIEARQARERLDRLNVALGARDAALRLAELEEKLISAETLRSEIEQADAELAFLKVPEKAIAELQNLDIEIARLKAIAEAGKPSVVIEYETDAPLVRLEGEPLQDGESRSYEGQARLAIPGVGLLTLRSNRPTDDDDSLPRFEERRRAVLASMAVNDLTAARQRQANAQRREGDQRDRKTRLSMLAPDGLPKLREAAAVQRADAGSALEVKEDPFQIRASLAGAEAKRLTAWEAWRITEPRQAGASEAVVGAETAFARLNAEWAQIEAALGPEATRLEREREMAARLEEFDTQLANHAAAVERLKADRLDLSAAEATLRRVRSVAEAADKEIGRLREETAGYSAEIRARSDDAIEETWREALDALVPAKARVEAYEKEVAVLQRLRSALENAREQARETYLMPVMKELGPLLQLLFDDVAITFDERTLRLRTILRNGQEEDFERLSGGMREQLSVLTRLAFARLLAKDGRPAPVILDDALVYSDDDRIEKMFDALHRQADTQQIIVFSCRQRAFQKLGGNVLHMSVWTPGS